ncbi:hypothetical protein PG994_008306 [Apiospora phragmitis]|uniref:Rhodopsin domain-containing protein n=1 Tax=Apiospora phragmitis TaxID=2905665 RepID=A0ABR1UV58_9PEZI
MVDSMATAMTFTMIVCGVVTLFFMSARFAAKALVHAKLGIDDYVLALSWVCVFFLSSRHDDTINLPRCALFIVFIVFSVYTTGYGLGSHLDASFDMTKLPTLLFLLPIGQFFAVVAVAVSKSSFIITLLRLVEVTWQKVALWFMLVTILLSMASISIVQFYQCATRDQPDCVPSDSVVGLGVFAAGYSAVMDLVLTAFPSVVIWGLQMKIRDKIGIILSMSLGLVAGVVGLYKTSTIPYVSRSADFAYGTSIVLIWLVAEVSATIIAASIPFYRPFFRRNKSSGNSAGGGNSGTPKSPSASYALGNRKRVRDGHSMLDSGVDHKGASDANNDNNSDKAILGKDHARIIRQTNISVNYLTDEEANYSRGQQHHNQF